MNGNRARHFVREMRLTEINSNHLKQEIMALSIKQIDFFRLTVMRIAGFLEYLQQFVKLVRAFAYTEGKAESKLPARVQPYFTALASAVAGVDSAYKQSRASDLTKRIADEDTRRDNLYTALKNQVQMYLKFLPMQAA